MEVEKEKLYKEFSHRGVTVCRAYYESMPCQMFALEMSDEKMLKIAKDTYDLLISNGWEDGDMSMIGNGHDDDSRACMIDGDFWKFMEKAAVENGMIYYEDIKEGE